MPAAPTGLIELFAMLEPGTPRARTAVDLPSIRSYCCGRNARNPEGTSDAQAGNDVRDGILRFYDASG